MTDRRRTSLLVASVLALSALAAGAQAQRFGRPEITLYELPNFQGRAITLTGSTSDLGRWRFNDQAQSARVQGRWRVCEHGDFRGHCQEIGGDVPDLTAYGLSGQISSLEPAFGADRGFEGRPAPGPGYPPPGRDARGVEGTRTVFFPRPSVEGLDVAAGDRGANVYCRRQGLGEAVWYDSSQRAGQAIGPDGEFVGRSTVLRDLLCRKY